MDKDKRKAVQRLEDLASNACYTEIVSNLILCHEHRPQERQLNWLPFSSVLSTIPYMKSKPVLAFVKSRLDRYLVGTMGDQLRKKYVEKFYQSIQDYSREPTSDSNRDDDDNKERKAECVVDIWVFLHCVLDNSFEELKIHAAFPGAEPNLKLIPIVAKHSPLLKKLKLDFSVMNSETELKKLKYVIRSLKLLKHLTDLSLDLRKVEDELRPTLLSLISKACPLLSRLEVAGDGDFKNAEILAIFTGKVDDDVVEKTSEEPTEEPQGISLERLELSRASLAPVCFTLKEFRLLSSAEFPASTAAFILRHLPLLEVFHIPGSSPISTAVKIIHDQFKFPDKCKKEELEKSDAGPSPESISQCTIFSGTLALTVLDSVNVLDREMLRAVGSSCPSLKTASFIRKEDQKGSDNDDKQGPAAESLVSPKELQDILNNWPKVTTVTIKDLRSDYVTSILKVFGGELSNIDFENGCEFSLQDLSSLCPKLESLRISGDYCSLQDSSKTGPPLSPDTFLPNLKEFVSKICLGSWSHLIENKSTLTSLSLYCCHIGCKDKEDSSDRPRKRFKSEIESQAIQSESDWNRIPQMWPQLEVLKIGTCTGLTMDKVANLVPQFHKLKEIWLPYRFTSTTAKRDLSYTVRDQLSIRKPAIQLKFYSWDEDIICPHV